MSGYKKYWKKLSKVQRRRRALAGWETRRRRAKPKKVRPKDHRRVEKLKKLGLNEDEARAQLRKTKCDCCDLPFGDNTAHIDHDHQTGKFRGMVHQQCNIALGMFKDNPGALVLAAKYADPYHRSPQSQDSGDEYLEYFEEIAGEDVAGLLKAAESYGNSWKQGGGANAFAMLKRKWDRLILQVSRPEVGMDIFKAAFVDKRSEGLIDDIRDLRRYLLLVEAELRARGVVHGVHRDNQEESQ